MKTTKMLREMLNSGEPFLTAGANDALSAVIAERAGFKAVTMGGYLATAVTMARPDIGPNDHDRDGHAAASHLRRYQHSRYS